MNKLIYLISIFLFIFIIASNGCKEQNIKVNKSEISNNSKNDKGNFLNDSSLDFSKNPKDIRIFKINKTIKTKEFKDDINEDIKYYTGIYKSDSLDENGNGIPELERLFINKDGDKIKAEIKFYEGGKMLNQYSIIDPEIRGNFFRGFIVESKDKEIIEGKFVYYPYETAENGKITGIVFNRKGKLKFYISVYTNGIQDLF